MTATTKDEDPYIEWRISPVKMLVKYFQDGTIEQWLSNDDNEELYLIKSYKHPSGRSPVVRLNRNKESEGRHG